MGRLQPFIAWLTNNLRVSPAIPYKLQTAGQVECKRPIRAQANGRPSQMQFRILAERGDYGPE
jgi:hypothetical protein